MENILNTIKNFFTITVMEFAKTNWFWVEIALLALVLILFIAVIAKGHKNRKLKKQNEESVSSMKAQVSQQQVELGSLKQTKDSLEKSLKISKDLVASGEMKYSTLEKELQDKDSALANLTIEAEKVKNQYSTLKTEHEDLKTKYNTVVSDLDKAETDMILLKEEKAKVEKALLSESQKYKDIDLKYRDALSEIDRLSNYEVENEILLKTIKNFNKEDATIKTKMEKEMELLNEKVDMLFNTTTIVEPKVQRSAPATTNNFNEMKRSELFELAKKVGLRDFATWNNEKLRKEISLKTKR